MRPLVPLLSLVLLLVPAVAHADEPRAFLTLGGYDRTSYALERRERGAFLTLGIPFDRLGQPAARAAPEPLVPLVRTAAPGQAEPLDLGVPGRLARACVSAAWRAAGLGEDDDRIDGILTRARWSAILPEARFRAVRYANARFTYDATDDGAAAYDYTGANTGLEARLTWRFDRLVYANDEPQLERLRMDHLEVRHRIGQKVLEALFHWERALLDLRTLPPGQQGTRDEADVYLRVVEAESALDVLTNGWFSAHKPKTKAAASVTGPGKVLGDL